MEITKQKTLSVPDSVKPVVPIFSEDPKEAFQQAEHLVSLMRERCCGPSYIVEINGKRFPKLEWWTCLSLSLGLFPQVVFARRLRRRDEIAYEARVELRRNGTVISTGEALCSNREKHWQHAEEYAIKSMAITRASGKAYRIPLSFLAVMAGLEATPAEEMPYGQKSKPGPPPTQRQRDLLRKLLKEEHLSSRERFCVQKALSSGMDKAAASQLISQITRRRDSS